MYVSLTPPLHQTTPELCVEWDVKPYTLTHVCQCLPLTADANNAFVWLHLQKCLVINLVLHCKCNIFSCTYVSLVALCELRHSDNDDNDDNDDD